MAVEVYLIGRERIQAGLWRSPVTRQAFLTVPCWLPLVR